MWYKCPGRSGHQWPLAGCSGVRLMPAGPVGAGGREAKGEGVPGLGRAAEGLPPDRIEPIKNGGTRQSITGNRGASGQDCPRRREQSIQNKPHFSQPGKNTTKNKSDGRNFLVTHPFFFFRIWTAWEFSDNLGQLHQCFFPDLRFKWSSFCEKPLCSARRPLPNNGGRHIIALWPRR